jgi:hypothetical protein
VGLTAFENTLFFTFITGKGANSVHLAQDNGQWQVALNRVSELRFY